MRSTEACYINKTYVEAMGYTLPDTLTWDFVWKVADAATKKNADGTFAVNGQKVMIPFIYKSTDNMMIQLLRQSGGGYSNDQGEVLLFNDTTKELLYTIAKHVKTGLLLHLQDIQLSGKFSECRPVHIRHRLYGGRHMDGHPRPPFRHKRGQAGRI